MLPVFIIFFYEHLSVAMFKLSWLERSSIRPSEVGHLSIFTKGVYIKRCRLSVEVATLSINLNWIICPQKQVLQITKYWLNWACHKKGIKNVVSNLKLFECLRLANIIQTNRGTHILFARFLWQTKQLVIIICDSIDRSCFHFLW